MSDDTSRPAPPLHVFVPGGGDLCKTCGHSIHHSLHLTKLRDWLEALRGEAVPRG